MSCFLTMPGCYFWRPTRWTNKIPKWTQKKNKQHRTRKPGSGCSGADLAGNLAGERLVTPVPVSAHRHSTASSAAWAGRNFCHQEPVYAAQCCRPASRRRGCWSLPLAAVAVELTPASLVEVHGRLDWVYGRSVGRSAGWCFCSRASRGPWQGTSGRAPTSEWASIFLARDRFWGTGRTGPAAPSGLPSWRLLESGWALLEKLGVRSLLCLLAGHPSWSEFREPWAAAGGGGMRLGKRTDLRRKILNFGVSWMGSCGHRHIVALWDCLYGQV